MFQAFNVMVLTLQSFFFLCDCNIVLNIIKWRAPCEPFPAEGQPLLIESNVQNIKYHSTGIQTYFLNIFGNKDCLALSF